MLNALRRRREETEASGRIARAISARAREPLFFESFGVADTFDGRFDLVVLHAWLVLDELARRGDEGLMRRLVDTLFAQFDGALREQGAGDIGIGRRIKKIAQAFYGRLEAYRAAKDTSLLAEAIERNVYRGVVSNCRAAEALAAYAMSAKIHLLRSMTDKGEIAFGPLPAAPGRNP